MLPDFLLIESRRDRCSAFRPALPSARLVAPSTCVALSDAYFACTVPRSRECDNARPHLVCPLRRASLTATHLALIQRP